MFKKSQLILSTIAVASLASANAQILCAQENSNCTGFFYEDINAAFIDCFDSNGAISSRKEHFYTSILEKECSNSTYSNFSSMLNGTAISANVSGSAMVQACDYFEIGVGYQFTQANQDIGLVVIESKVGGARDLFYKNLNVTEGALYWDWTELAALIEAFTGSQCGNSSSSSGMLSNSSVGVNIPAGLEEIVAWITKYAQLEVIEKCHVVMPVINSTMPVVNSTNSSNSTVGVNSTIGVNSTVNSTENSTSTVNTTIPANNSTNNSSDNSTIGLNSTSVNSTVNSTDNSSVDSNSTVNSTIGMNSTDNSTSIGNSSSLGGSGAGLGLDNSSNSTNSTLNSTENSTTSMNSTVNSTESNSTSNSSSGYFNSNNFTMPSGCSYSNSDNQTISCVASERQASFSFAQLNEFWDFSASSTCQDAVSQYTSCQTNTVITNFDQCFRESFYNTFQLAEDQFAYAFFYFDSAAQSDLLSYCNSSISSFNITSDEFSAGFQFDFGNLALNH